MKPIKVQTGQITSFDGTEIYYEVRGEGPPLVFLYGIGCLFNHWNYQVSFFSHNFQTIQIDYRSHQKSSIPEDHVNLNINSLAKDVLHVLNELDIQEAGF